MIRISEPKVQGSGFRASGSVFWGGEIRISVFEFTVSGFRFGDEGSEFRVDGWAVQVWDGVDEGHQLQVPARPSSRLGRARLGATGIPRS